MAIHTQGKLTEALRLSGDDSSLEIVKLLGPVEIEVSKLKTFCRAIQKTV